MNRSAACRSTMISVVVFPMHWLQSGNELAYAAAENQPRRRNPLTPVPRRSARKEQAMKTSRLISLSLGLFLMPGAAAYAEPGFKHADPFEFDPADSRLVQSTWLPGIGCPTGARTSDGTYTDPACPTGDRRDRQNEGLLLVKNGPKANNGSAGVVLRDVHSTVTELGYGLRKSGASADMRGS